MFDRVLNALPDNASRFNWWSKCVLLWKIPSVLIVLPVIGNQRKTKTIPHTGFEPFISNNSHCAKSIQIRSYFWSVFSRIRTEYGPEITPYLDIFHAMSRYKTQKVWSKVPWVGNARNIHKSFFIKNHCWNFKLSIVALSSVIKCSP